jgi:hypothetical protein
MDSGSAAAEATTALERLQHQHMKYVRRSLHALHEALHSQTDVVSEGANAEPRIEPGRLAGASAAASEVHLYMGADECTGDVSKAGVDLDLDLASADGSNANASEPYRKTMVVMVAALGPFGHRSAPEFTSP